MPSADVEDSIAFLHVEKSHRRTIVPGCLTRHHPRHEETKQARRSATLSGDE